MDCDPLILCATTDSTIRTSELLELCRLCANTDNQLINIFNGEGLEHNISMKIEKHIPIIKVTETDQLPLQICYQCASTLIAWHNLYEGCVAADKRLREILSIEDEQILDSDKEHRDDHMAFEDTGAGNVSNEKFASKTNDDEEARRNDASTSNNPSNTILSYQDYTMTPVLDTEGSNISYATKTDDIPSTSAENDSYLGYNFCPKVIVKKNTIKLNLRVSNSETHGSTNRLQLKRKSEKKPDRMSSNSSNNFHCAICLKVCLTKNGLNRHIMTKHKMTLACDQNLQNFESIDITQTHTNECHKNLNTLPTKNGANMDSKCEKLNDNEPASISEKYDPDNFICATCNKNFPKATSLRRHLRNGHRRQEKRNNHPLNKWNVEIDGQKYLKCDKCSYNSPAFQKLRFSEHYRIHTGEKPYMCGECGKMFRTKTLMKKHILHVHQGVKEHPCDICGRKFSDRRFVAEHRRTHTGERPYVCDLCGKTFAQSASLFIHQELHKGLRKHPCPVCSKRFVTRSSLAMHVKRHGNVRNFVCAECGKAFIDRKHLKDHMTVHSNERPFICEICSRGFKLPKHLKQHKRTHQRDLLI